MPCKIIYNNHIARSIVQKYLRIITCSASDVIIINLASYYQLLRPFIIYFLIRLKITCAIKDGELSACYKVEQKNKLTPAVFVNICFPLVGYF